MVKIDKKDVLSIGVAVVAAIMVGHVWLKRDREFKNATHMTPCLVAKRYVGAGKILQPRDVDVKQIPLAYHEPGVLSGLTSLGHLQLRFGVVPGEQITMSKLVDPLAKVSLSWSLPKGHVAVSLKLPYEHVVGAQIVAGDHVAIFGSDRKLSSMLKRVQVFEVSHESTDEQTHSTLIQTPKDVLFTLALPFDHAAALFTLQNQGSLYFALLPAFESSFNRGL